MKTQRTLIAAAALLAACGRGAPPAPAPQADPLDRPPAPAALEPVSFPAFHERTLANGARVIVVENHEQPVVSITARILSGETADPEGSPGVAAFTADLLTKGTSTRTARQIAETIDFVGGSLSAGAGNDWTNVGTTVVTPFLDTALVLLSDVILHPTFPQDELEIQQRRMLSALQVEMSQPQAIANRSFLGEVYGRHPYGTSLDPDDVRAITRDELVAFHAAHYVPSNALFVVAGDVSPDQIVARLNAAFAGWESRVVASSPLPAPIARRAPELVFVHMPNTVQAVVRVGKLLPPATDPDWVALDVARQILGGGSTGWLFNVLREQKGYTYGAYASAVHRRQPGYFQAGAEVRNEVADSAMTELFALIDSIRTAPVPQQDLALAREFMTGSFPLSIETPQQVASQVANAKLLGLPDTYLEQYRTRVAQVSAEDVQRVAAEHFDPSRMVVVVVGDAGAIYDRVAQAVSDAAGVAATTRGGNGGAIATRLLNAQGEPITLESIRAPTTAMEFDAAAVPIGTRRYAIVFQGNAVGQSTSVTTRESVDGRAVIRSTGEVAGPISARSEVLFDAATFEPISASLRGGRFTELVLRVENGRVVGHATEGGGEPKPIDVEAPAGVLLTGMDELALAVTDLDVGSTFTLPIAQPPGVVRTLTYNVTGTSTVTVPAGTFEVFEIEVQGGDQPMRLYVRREAPHILIKQELVGTPVSIELTQGS